MEEKCIRRVCHHAREHVEPISSKYAQPIVKTVYPVVSVLPEKLSITVLVSPKTLVLVTIMEKFTEKERKSKKDVTLGRYQSQGNL